MVVCGDKIAPRARPGHQKNGRRRDGTFGAILKCCLLTAQRREKVASMQWKNVVDDEWRILAVSR
jgi:hypothetical protein